MTTVTQRLGGHSLGDRGRGPSLLARALAAVALAAVAGCENRNEKLFPVVRNEFPPPNAPTFGTPRAIDPTPATSSSAIAFDAARDVAFDGDGNALLLMRGDDGTGVTRLFAVRYDARKEALSSPFASPLTVDANTGGNVDQARVLLDAAGDGVIVFSQTYQGKRRAYGRTFNRSAGTFGAPTAIDVGGSNSLPEDVTGVDGAIAAGGNAVLAFSEADDVFGVRFVKGTGFGQPQQIDSLGNVGNTVSALRVHDQGGVGGVTWLQDADTSGGVRRVLACSRHSTSGSLSFAVTVNPDTSTDVTDATARVCPGGTLVLAWTQTQSAGGTRVFGRRLSASGSLATAADLGGTVSGTFAEPVAGSNGLGGVLVAVRHVPSSGPARLYANLFAGGATGAFASSPTRVDDATAGAVVSGSARVACDPQGRAEIVFVQEQDPALAGSHGRVLAVRYTPSGGYGAPRALDHGPVETGALVTTPLVYAAPVVTGVTFDAAGRGFCSYTQSDGRLRRCYVVAGVSGTPGAFGAPEPVDGATRNSLFTSLLPVTNQVEAGDGAFALAPNGISGLGLFRQRDVNGTTNVVRLWATPWSGYQAPATRLRGARLLDAYQDAAAPRDVAEFATALDQTGAGLVVWTQADGSGTRLLAAPIATTGIAGAPLGTTTTLGSGASAPPTAPRILINPQTGDAHVLFLQDDGTGRVQLYARRWARAAGTLGFVGPSSPTGANDPIALTAGTAGSVVSYDAAYHTPDGSAYIVFRQVKAVGSGAEGVFAVKVTAAGGIVGPTEFSDTSATVVGDPRIDIDDKGNALTVFNQGAPPVLCSRHSTSSSLGMAVSGLPPVVSASTAACGAFDVAHDAAGNFLVAFVRDDTGTSTPAGSIVARRWLTATKQWEGTDATKVSAGTATTTAPTLAYAEPRVAMDTKGRAVILFRQDDDRPTTDTVNLVAVTFDPAAAMPYASPVVIDNGDGSVNNGLDVHPTVFDVVLRRSDGEGLVTFVQDADPTAAALPRLYALRLHLANVSTGNPVFDTTASDLSEGGGAATAVTGATAAFGTDGRGWIAFTEQAGADADSLRTHAFVRSYGLGTGVFGSSLAVSRSLLVGDGTAGSGAEGEHAARPVVTLGPSGAVRVTYLVQQDADGSTPGTLDRARLLADVVR